MERQQIIRYIDKTAFFLFAIVVFFLPISIAAIEISFFGILVCFIARCIVSQSTKDFKIVFCNRINTALFLFFIAIGLSVFFAGPLWQKSLHAWLSKWGEGIFLYYSMQVFLTRKDIKNLLYVFLVSLALVVTDGLYQKVLGVDFLRGYPVKETADGAGHDVAFAITATFKHFNNYAAFLVVSFFVAQGFLCKKNSLLAQSMIVGLLTGTFLSLLFTYSRGAWVAFFAGGMCMCVLARKKQSILLGIVLLVLLFIGVSYLPLIRERLFSSGNNGRFGLWLDALHAWKQVPLLGVGIGLFMDRVAIGGQEIHGQYAHNCYIQMLTETGILGLGTFLYFVLHVLCKAYRTIRAEHDHVLIGMFLGLTVYLVHAFFDTHLYAMRLSILFWILTGFIITYIYKEGDCGVQKDTICAS